MLRALVCIVVLISSNFNVLFSQTDNVGSGGAIQFDGIDDYIDFGDIYSDLQLPFTISAWVKLDPANDQPGAVFTNRNCDPIYTGFRLIVNNNAISMDYGDGLGGNNPAFRHGKNANVDLLTGNWNHITAVVRNRYDIDLYLNGVNVGGDYSGGSDKTMDSSKPGFASTAYFKSNGIIYRFNGTVDDIRLWNRALSQSEIRDTMCVNLAGSESGLVGYWNFNETNGNTVFDLSANHFNGMIKGNPKRVRSGAPIGDQSVYLYPTSWAGQQLTLDINDQQFTVKDVSNSCKGVHIYGVKKFPSITTGITEMPEEELYFGVFTAQQFPTSTFTIEIDNVSNCGQYIRDDNSTSPWTSEGLIALQRRIEFIQAPRPGEIDFDLGNDKVLCDNMSYEIATGLDDSEHTFKWSNGATTPSVTVTASGKYRVQASKGCVVKEDSVTVTFMSTPQEFLLGEDVVTCDFKSVTLTVSALSLADIQWSDGSKGNTMVVNSYGKYWATIQNVCGQVSDTITFFKPVVLDSQIPNVITPNSDEKNDLFVIPGNIGEPVVLNIYNRWGELIHHAQSYQNDWSPDELSPGVYFITLRSPCLESYKGTLRVLE